MTRPNVLRLEIFEVKEGILVWEAVTVIFWRLYTHESATISNQVKFYLQMIVLQKTQPPLVGFINVPCYYRQSETEKLPTHSCFYFLFYLMVCLLSFKP